MKILITVFALFFLNTSFAQTPNQKMQVENHKMTNHQEHMQDHKMMDHHEPMKHHKMVRAAGPFAPTEDLKVRMNKILEIATNLHTKQDDIQAIKESGNAITDTVNDIFKTCKLAPEPDQALHPILAGILESANHFKSGDYKEGMEKFHKELQLYNKTFSLKK